MVMISALFPVKQGLKLLANNIRNNIQDLIAFNAVDWQAKPMAWQASINTASQQAGIQARVDSIVNAIPERSIRIDLMKGQKGNDKLVDFIVTKINGGK